MNSTLAVLLVPVLLVIAVPVSALSSPRGVLPALVPRRWRWRYRKQRREAWKPFRQARGQQQSSRISKRLRAMVMRADRRRCVACGACGTPAVPLQVDHIVPWIMGGLTCLWNCAVLCRSCNMIKSAYWRSPQGKVYYRHGHRPPAAAAQILAAELAARRRWLRWLRAYL